MRLETEKHWSIGFMARVRELATCRVKTLRLVAVQASMHDGTGVRGVRSGAYTASDTVLLAESLPCDIPAPIRKRMVELETIVLPRPREDWNRLEGLRRRVG